MSNQIINLGTRIKTQLTSQAKLEIAELVGVGTKGFSVDPIAMQIDRMSKGLGANFGFYGDGCPKKGPWETRRGIEP